MSRAPRLLAVASGGGHWIELMRLRPAFAGWDVAFVSMFENYAASVPGARFHTIPDASRFSKLAFLRVAWRAAAIVMKERPDAIVTTGSAPMLFLVFFGRLIGARSLWIDSVAQSEELSLSGSLARRIASKTVSQWPDVARRGGVECWGSVL